MNRPFEIELDLSVCVVAGVSAQATKMLQGLLASIYESAYPIAFEVLVAERAEMGISALVDDFSGLLVARLAEGTSPVTAVNHLMRLTRGRYLAVLDADVLIRPNCFMRLLEFMDENPEVGVVGPRILDAYGSTVASGAVFPSLLEVAGLPLPRQNPRLLITTGEVDWLLGGVHLLRRELIEEIGLFDEACGDLAELDYYWRAKQKGWHSGYVFEAVALHANPARYHPEMVTAENRLGIVKEMANFLRKRWFS
ncbi:MAG: glycosyltransferase [Desulfobulbaceae bacterium]|nr:glycosyltransferase [Desulfobulbaceae bacterium]